MAAILESLVPWLSLLVYSIQPRSQGPLIPASLEIISQGRGRIWWRYNLRDSRCFEVLCGANCSLNTERQAVGLHKNQNRYMFITFLPAKCTIHRGFFDHDPHDLFLFIYLFICFNLYIFCRAKGICSKTILYSTLFLLNFLGMAN